MSDEVTDKIESNAQGPRRVRTDAGEVEAHPLPDQIEADKYLRAKAAADGGSSHRGLRFNVLKPPGTV
jgi:hypothetical protein